MMLLDVSTKAATRELTMDQVLLPLNGHVCTLHSNYARDSMLLEYRADGASTPLTGSWSVRRPEHVQGSRNSVFSHTLTLTCGCVKRSRALTMSIVVISGLISVVSGL